MYSNNKKERLEKYDKLIDKVNEIMYGSEEKVMSQRKLAKLIGNTSAQICRWLNKEQGLNMETAFLLCQVFNLEPTDYFEIFDNIQISKNNQEYSEYNNLISQLSEENLQKVYEYINYLLYLQNQEKEARRNLVRKIDK